MPAVMNQGGSYGGRTDTTKGVGIYKDVLNYTTVICDVVTVEY